MAAYSNRLLPNGPFLETAFIVTDHGNWFSFLILFVGKTRAGEEKIFSRPHSQMSTEFQFLPSTLPNGTRRLIILLNSLDSSPTGFSAVSKK